MRALLGKRIPIAWFLLAVIVLAATGIIWLSLSRSFRESDAVLIYSAPSFATTQPEVAVAAANPTADATTAPRATTVGPIQIAVYVSGAVASPGVYALPDGSRVGDAIEAAGGFTGEADREAINLASRVHDEQHISVPVLGAADNEPANGSTSPTEVAPTPPEATKVAQPPTPASVPGLINVNTATIEELDQLPGIGPVLAGRIVEDREANGPFRSVDDLLRVPGIGEVLLAKLRDLVTVGP